MPTDVEPTTQATTQTTQTQQAAPTEAPKPAATAKDRRAAAMAILDGVQAKQEPANPEPESKVEGEKPVEPAKKPPEAKPEPPKERDAARFAAIAKKEAELVRRQQAAKAELEAERAKIKAERDEIAKNQEEIKAFREQSKAMETARLNARRDPLAYLQAAGLSYEDATQFVLNNKQPTPDMLSRDAQSRAVRDELEQFKAQQVAELAKAREEFQAERQKAAEQEKARVAAEQKQLTERFHGEVIDFVKQNAAQYELTNLLQQGGLVVQVLEEHFSTTGKAMKYAEAADLVEKYLEEQSEKVLASSKFKSKLAPPAPQAGEKPGDTAQQPRRAVTNQMTASTSSARPRTREDRMKAALAILDKG